jgi:hypothetical protein
MRLCTTRPGVRRAWTVELRPQPGGPILVCQQCSHSRRPLSGTSARSELLAHLAQHARRDLLPVHLRTCQCHERGCSWHPRHRGCGGPIRLVLARERGGRLWRLADACTACAAATSQAAVVPDTFINAATTPSEHADIRRTHRIPRGPDRQTRVREMLNYLASALPTETGPAARLIALQCALRMNDSAQVRLPLGVLRSLRLQPATASWQELHQARWLCATLPTSRCNAGAVVIQLLDVGLFAQCPARPDRLAAADWALRAACRLRTDCAPLPQLITTCLTAHTAPDSIYGIAEVDRLAHECGLATTEFTGALNQLTAAGRIDSWSVDSASGNLHWTLTENSERGCGGGARP